MFQIAKVDLVLDREGQVRRKASTVPLWADAVFQHSGKEHIPFLFQGTQCPDNPSNLYLPDNNLACVVALSTSHGEDPHVRKRGWDLVRPRKLVLRYLIDERLEASSLSLDSQYCRTAVLAMDLTCSLLGWFVNQVTGCGRPYWIQTPLSFQNQDFEDGFAEEKTFMPCLASMLSPSLSLQS